MWPLHVDPGADGHAPTGSKWTVMAERQHLPAGLTPRLLSRTEAAEYCGLSPSAFDQYVARGVPPLEFGRRNLWDIRALDRWLDHRSGLAHADGNDGTNEWDVVLK
jgi:hypothetical protein